MAVLAGVCVAAVAYTLAAAAGLAALIAAVPGLIPALRWVGVAYLAHTAVSYARAAAAAPATAPPIRPRGAFAHGLAVSAGNPKAWAFYALLLPAFADPGAGAIWPQVVALGLLDLAIALPIYAGAGLAATRLPRHSRALDAALAALFAAYAAGFALLAL
jgi:threonine/homoserine/homoserine lactone efflux protein